ncbi:MAG TPA: hypothetical protein PKD00_01735, partial [Burkholderiales bacterium]|nr:hypothetical protein [Burkholderiales bacterium]
NMPQDILITIVTSILTFLTGVFGVHFWNTKKNSNDNLTKVDLKKLELEQVQAQEAVNKSQYLIQELTAQNKKLVSEIELLEKKINELKLVVEKTLSSFEMMMLVLKDAFDDNQALSNALHTTYEQIKKAANTDIITKQKIKD